MSAIVLQSDLQNMPVRRGKVRDVYDFGDRLLFVATDRISAFDYILPTGIPRKGEVLTRISRFWFDQFDVENHFLTDDLDTLHLPDTVNLDALRGRSMVVRKTDVVPYECVVRGYLAGSGWLEYQKSGTVCGIPLPSGLQESSQLPEPRQKPKKATTRTSALITCVAILLLARSWPQSSGILAFTFMLRVRHWQGRRESSSQTPNLNSDCWTAKSF